MPRITDFCFKVAVFISKIGINISCRKTSISFYGSNLILVMYFDDIMLRLYLEFCPHTRKHAPEDLHADFEDLRYRAEGIATKAKTKVLFRCVDERCSLVRRC